MGHLTTRDAYRNLGDRINWFTQGASVGSSVREGAVSRFLAQRNPEVRDAAASGICKSPGDGGSIWYDP